MLTDKDWVSKTVCVEIYAQTEQMAVDQRDKERGKVA